MKLHTLRPAQGATHKEKRIGRGEASGKGGTSTKGNKGGQSRAGYKSKMAHEGGQMPIQRRLPKRGFFNHRRTLVEAVNLAAIEDFIARKKLTAKIDREALEKAGLVKKTGSLVKILLKGEVKTKLDITADLASETAVKAVEKAGGKITLPKKEEKAA